VVCLYRQVALQSVLVPSEHAELPSERYEIAYPVADAVSAVSAIATGTAMIVPSATITIRAVLFLIIVPSQ
jgi:hypothetical protein